MTVTLTPGERSGAVTVPSSKSAAHRMLICAALGREKTVVSCRGVSKDVEATARCLDALCARVRITGNVIESVPGRKAEPGERILDCGESGSTLRFLVPVAGALGENASFRMSGRLPSRPMDALTDVLSEKGMRFSSCGDTLSCGGKLVPGIYRIPGNISSQFVSGLLFALPLLGGDSVLEITGTAESAGYISMTESALAESGIVFSKEGGRYAVPGNQRYRAPGGEVEGDWSAAAFFVCAGAVSEKGIAVNGLSSSSVQGDRMISAIAGMFGAETDMSGGRLTVRRNALNGITLDASGVPDLVPAVAALAAGCAGTTRIVNAARLRLKESDRIASTARMLRSLGADVSETADGLVINGKETLDGGVADPSNDHRIAMAAAVAACFCRNPVTVLSAECVEKSYPDFWRDYNSLEVKK